MTQSHSVKEEKNPLGAFNFFCWLFLQRLEKNRKKVEKNTSPFKATQLSEINSWGEFFFLVEKKASENK